MHWCFLLLSGFSLVWKRSHGFVRAEAAVGRGPVPPRGCCAGCGPSWPCPADGTETSAGLPWELRGDRTGENGRYLKQKCEVVPVGRIFYIGNVQPGAQRRSRVLPHRCSACGCCDAPPVMPKSHCGSCPVSSAAKITGIETRSLTQVA